MKTYKQRAEDILKKAQHQKNIRKAAVASVLSTVACAVIIAFSCVLFVPFDPPANPMDAYKNNEYYAVIKPLNARFESKNKAPVYKNNYEKWTAALKDMFSFGMEGGSNAMPDHSVNDSAIQVPEQDTDFGESGEYVETTDNQVAGVIEGDLFKRTKTHIFYLSNMALQVYTIDGENSQKISEFEVTTAGKTVFTPEMYLSADGKTVTVVRSILSVQGGKRYTEVVTLDVSNPMEITERERNYLSGQYVSSRSTNGKLLIVNNFNVSKMPNFDDYASYIPQYGDSMDAMKLVNSEDIIVPETIITNQHTVVMELDQTTGETMDCMALYCYSADMYVSQSNLYLTRNYVDYGTTANTNDDMQDSMPYYAENMTEITCISYGESFEKIGGVTVSGFVLNQYSMDEYNGIFRVVTSVNVPYTSASIYCVDMQTWEIIGSVKAFSPRNEDVQSVRFDKEMAYVCTAEVITLTDPVYAFNLSDPTNITYKDTGEIKGYSTSLVQFGDGYLLGIGYNNSRSLKIEMYRETESGVEIVCTYEPANSTDFSTDYKSYFIDRERGLIGLGVIAIDYKQQYYANEYRLLCFDGYEFVEVLKTELQGENEYKRATLIEDENGCGYFYMFGDGFKVEKIYG